MPPDATIKLPERLGRRLMDGLVALSVANLIYLKVAFDLLSDKDRFFNHLPVTTPMLLALIFNILGVAALVWLLIQLTRRLKRHWLQLPFHLAFLATILWPLDFFRIKFLNITDAGILYYATQPVMLLMLLCLLALVIWKHRAIAGFVAVIYGILSPLAVWHLIQVTGIVLGILHLKTCEAHPVPAAWQSVSAARPRVVWIIFDETDYRLAFAQRPPGVKLPEFDRLQGESLSATTAYPPGDGTSLSMPSLIAGERVAKLAANDACDATLTFVDSGRTAEWSGLPSVFSRAQALGFNTGLVGWYLPYDRVLGRALNSCSWYSYPGFQPARATNFTAEVALQLASLGEMVFTRYSFIQLHRHTLADALALAADARLGLTLLHLPTPHRPGVYLPDQQKFTVVPMNKVKGYLNNLALADHELGEIRRTLVKAQLWDRTWIILSSDHSWRESLHYDNVRDLRVPFLVKSPGVNPPVSYPQQFNTVLTGDLILDILQGRVTNQQAVTGWLDERAPAHHDIPTPGTMF